MTEFMAEKRDCMTRSSWKVRPSSGKLPFYVTRERNFCLFRHV